MTIDFKPLKIAVLTISDTRTEETDFSGKILVERLTAAGHQLVEKALVMDDIYQIRALVSRWIADKNIEIILTTGGTGLTGRDQTPEAIQPLLDKQIDGFGELFRFISYQEIQTSTLHSRAFAGVANATTLFCLPGSTGACETAWDKLIQPQLNSQTHPCNLTHMFPRLNQFQRGI